MTRLLACPYCGWQYDPDDRNAFPYTGGSDAPWPYGIGDAFLADDPADVVPWHAAPAGTRGACPGNGDTPAPARTGGA